jgi:hypothetical protein
MTSRPSRRDSIGSKARFDALQTTVSGLQGTVGGLQATVNGLIRDLPKIVADAVREASPGRDGKR